MGTQEQMSIEELGAEVSSSVLTPLRFLEISVIDFESDKFFYATASRCHGGITDAEKRIQHGFDARASMQFDAPFSELNRERRGMRSFFFSTLNRFVRHKPGVPATTQILPRSMRPPCDVALVLIRYSQRQPA